MNIFNQNTNTNRYYKKAINFHRNKKSEINPKAIESKYICFSSPYLKNDAFTFRNDNLSNCFVIHPKKTILSNNDNNQDSIPSTYAKYNNPSIPSYYVPKKNLNKFLSFTNKNKRKGKYDTTKIIYIQKYIRSFISNRKMKLMKFIEKIKKIFLCHYIKYIYRILIINYNKNNIRQVYQNSSSTLKYNINMLQLKKNTMSLVTLGNKTLINKNNDNNNLTINNKNTGDLNDNIIIMPNCPNIHSNKYNNNFSNFNYINNNEDEKYKDIFRPTEKSNENPENGKVSNKNYINSLKNLQLKDIQNSNKDDIENKEITHNPIQRSKNRNKKNSVPICLENSHDPSLSTLKKTKNSKLVSKNLDDSIDCLMIKEEKDANNKNRDLKKYNNDIIKKLSEAKKSKISKSDFDKEATDEKSSFYDENEFVIISYDYNKNNNSTGYSSNTIKCNIEDYSFAFKGFDLIKSEKNNIYNKNDNIYNFNRILKKTFRRNGFNYVFKLFNEIISNEEMNNDKTICDNCSTVSSGRIIINGENYDKAINEINSSNINNVGFICENTASGSNSEHRRNNTSDLNFINSSNKNWKIDGY